MTKPSLDADATPEAYAEAMIRCQGYAPACSDLQECQHDGRCFGHDGMGFAKARQTVEALIESEKNVWVRSWLKVGLDALDRYRFIGALDAMRYVQAHKAALKIYGLTDGERQKAIRNRLRR